MTATKEAPVEQLDDLGEVHQRAGQPVYFVHDHDLDPASGYVGEQALKRGPVQGPAGESAIVVGRRDEAPALTLLAADESLAGLALGMEGIEVLLQPLFGGFAGVDRAQLGR